MASAETVAGTIDLARHPLPGARPSDAAWWTGAGLRAVPGAEAVSPVVDAVRDWWSREGVAGCEAQMARLGWAVRGTQLGAASGGLQALLLPRLSGGFTVVVDPDRTPAQIASQVDPVLVRQWRLAHEYAHTFFYRQRDVPRRGGRPGQSEEVFCDLFADQILNLDLASCSGGQAN